MGVAAGTGEESARGGSDGAGAVGTVGVEVGDGVETGAGAGAGVTTVVGVGVGVPAPASASAGTADNAPADKVPASAIARAAPARTIGWNFGVFTGPPYLPSFARMAVSSGDVTPWRNR